MHLMQSIKDNRLFTYTFNDTFAFIDDICICHIQDYYIDVLPGINYIFLSLNSPFCYQHDFLCRKIYMNSVGIVSIQTEL